MSGKLKTEVMPTNERLARGDVRYTSNGRYRSSLPTVLEYWRQKGFLGSGSKQENRYSACEILLELAEHTNLMASNTIDYNRVDGLSTAEQPEISPIDHIRFIMSKISLESGKIFRRMIAEPDKEMPSIPYQSVTLAMDELVDAIEIWKKSDLFLEK